MEKLNKIILFDIDYTLFKTAVFKDSNHIKFELYEEILNVLNALSDKYTLGIFSEGDIEFQKDKLINTKIYHLFDKDHIHIASRKDDLIHEIAEKYRDQQVFIVDDKLPVLFQLKKLMPSLKTIWIKRGAYAESQPDIAGFTPDAILPDLTSLSPETLKI